MAATGKREWVVWLLDGQRHALPLEAVERVLPAPEITPLPQAPPLICGVINVQGRIVPVIDLRRRFGMPPCALRWRDHLVLARSARRLLAFGVDAVQGLVDEPAEAITLAAQIAPGLEAIAGTLTLPDGLLLIHDLDRLLSLDDEQALAAALADLPGTLIA
jgi:purine-binding chemotaxis protein CheW